MFSFWLHIFFLLHLNYCTFPLHMNLLGFFNLFLILRFLFSYDLLSHYFDWFLSTLKNHNIQKPRPPKNFLPKYTTSITWTCNGKFTFWIFKRTWPNFCKVMIKRLCKKFIYMTYWHRYNGNVRCQWRVISLRLSNIPAPVSLRAELKFECFFFPIRLQRKMENIYA